MLSRKDSETRQHLLSVAAAMIKENGSAKLRVVDVAKQAHVGVPTIYYHFESRTQLIAEAQLSNYLVMVLPLHELLSMAELAVAADDETSYLAAIEENMVRAWTSGQFENKVGIVKLLLDVWSDPKALREFSELLDIQFKRWTSTVEGAQKMGWISSDIDAKALVAFFWTASIGQIITANSTYMDMAPHQIRDFVMTVVQSARQSESTIDRN